MLFDGRHANRQYTVELLVHEGEGTLAVSLVLALVDVLHDQHVVLNLQSVSVELLAAHITNADVNVCTTC